MSPQSLNNQAFHGRMITIKTVCKGLPRKNTHAHGSWEDLKAEVKQVLSGIRQAPFTLSRPENVAWRARLRVARTLTGQFSEKTRTLSTTSPGRLTSNPRTNPYAEHKLRLGFQQECPTARLQGVPLTENTVCSPNCATRSF